MIKNDRQFGITRKQADRLRSLREELARRPRSDLRTLRSELELAAVEGELGQLEADLAEYTSLKEGRVEPGIPQSLEDLPRILVRARIAAGLSQAGLAELLGLKAQQVQRYEATDYESASLPRLAEVAHVLNVTLSPDAVTGTTSENVGRALRKVGFDSGFVARRFGGGSSAANVAAIAGRAARVLNCLPEEVVAGSIHIDDNVHAAAYKTRAGANTVRLTVLATYAKFLAQVVRSATPDLPVDAPTSPTAIPSNRTVGKGLFKQLLSSVWSMGIPVLPLDEGGGFQAAVWSNDDRPIIVLNGSVRTEAHWSSLLLHEVGHIGRGDHNVIEGALSDLEIDDAEREVNEWASDVLLGGRSNELFDASMAAADGQIQLMQRAVRRVAIANSVDIGVLALNVAFRLSERGENWWGAAQNMVEPGDDPWQTTRAMLIDRVEWSSMLAVDADLLARSIDAIPAEFR